MRAIEWYAAFRGPSGVCGRLAECAASIAVVESGGRERAGNDVHVRTSGTSDPTQSAALSGMARVESLNTKKAELEALVARAGIIAASVRNGQVLDDYYLVANDRVTWSLLAEEYGQSTRTLMRWRDAACDEIDRRGLLWR